MPAVRRKSGNCAEKCSICENRGLSRPFLWCFGATTKYSISDRLTYGVMPIPELQIVGLLLDVLGAFIIVIPDIPFLRKYHRAGRLRNALTQLELVSLSKYDIGYSDVLETIHSIKPPEESDFDRPPEVIAKQMETLQASPMEKIYGFYSVEGEDEMAREKYSEIPYNGLRMRIQQEIGQGESMIRAFGFIILAGGFVVQIISLL